jgi:hypothetical protein
MAGQTERTMMAERMATTAVWVGSFAVLGGTGLLGLAVLGGGLPGALGTGGPWLQAVPGGVTLMLGLGLVLRGMTLSLAAETLANVRLLQEETHRARTQAAVYAHARREPMGELRPSTKADGSAVGKSRQTDPSSTPAPERKPIVKIATSGAPLPTVARATAQQERKASQKSPIKGKPFEPHPIFMARPPR